MTGTSSSQTHIHIHTHTHTRTHTHTSTHTHTHTRTHTHTHTSTHTRTHTHTHMHMHKANKRTHRAADEKQLDGLAVAAAGCARHHRSSALTWSAFRVGRPPPPGLQRTLFTALTLAPWSMSMRITSTRPFMAARCNGVCRSCGSYHPLLTVKPWAPRAGQLVHHHSFQR
jgi:hypothetical protein